jgi:hypothetical protein
MSRTTNLILCSAPLLLVGLASLATAQDEITPPLDPLEEGALADEGAPSTYTFEDDSLQLFDRSRRDGEPPIGIDITEENLPAGTSALRVRISQTSFDGLGDGRRDISSAAAFTEGYAVAPTSMTTNRTEIQYVRGYDERWTMWAVVPFIQNELKADIMGGGTSTSKASGLGDLRLGGNYLLHEDERQRVNLGIGLTVPTGSFDERDTYGAAPNSLLPYVAQLGGGTFDILPSAGWVKLMDTWSFGTRACGRFPIGENSDDWAFSREFDADFWAAHELSDTLTGTVRLNAQWWGDLHGRDAGLNPANSPLEDPARQGGTRVNLIGGIAWDLEPRGGPGSNRLELEFGIPVDERLDGPALKQEWSIQFGWKLSL